MTPPIAAAAAVSVPALMPAHASIEAAADDPWSSVFHIRGETLAARAGQVDGTEEQRGSVTADAWFPTAHLFAAMASGPLTQELLATVSAQSRFLRTLAHAVETGRVTLPPDLLGDLGMALVALPATLRP